MANWYYYNKSGEKVGPITPTALKALAMQGLITPETVIENGNGRSSVAGKVNGLTFPETEEALEVPLNEVDFGSPDEEEVYGLALPESKIPPPIESNPFTLVTPLDSNPFTGTMPVDSNPFADAMQYTSTSPSPQIPVTQSFWKYFAEQGQFDFAIGGSILLLLLMIIIPISQTGSSHSKDPKQAIIDVSKETREIKVLDLEIELTVLTRKINICVTTYNGSLEYLNNPDIQNNFVRMMTESEVCRSAGVPQCNTAHELKSIIENDKRDAERLKDKIFDLTH